MVNVDIIKKLMNCFNNSFINYQFEFIAHREANEYFRLEDCETELDVKCKVLEWFSRSCFKDSPFISNKKNNELHEFMLNGTNKFLNTNFTKDDIEIIYIYLGNRCNHNKTIEFISSEYDMNVLRKEQNNV